MKTYLKGSLFTKILLSFMLTMLVVLAGVMGVFIFIYNARYEKQMFNENGKEAESLAAQVGAFANLAYRITQDLALNSDTISMDTARQHALYAENIANNDYFSLLYAQGMDGQQTGRSDNGKLGNRKDRPWFIKMSGLRKPFISESYFSVNDNAPTTSVYYPIIRGGEMIGVMGSNIKLGILQDMVTKSNEPGTYSYILDGAGVVIAHPDSVYLSELYNYKKLTKQVSKKDSSGNVEKDAKGNIVVVEEKINLSPSYQAAISKLMAGETGQAKVIDQGKRLYMNYTPVPIDGESDPWYVVSIREEAAMMATRNTLIFTILIVGLALALIGVLVVLLVTRKITMPVKEINSALRLLSDGDMTVTVKTRTNDEIGELGGYFNQTIEKLQHLILTIKNQAASLSEIGVALATNMVNTGGAIAEMTESIDAIKGRVSDQSGSVNKTNESMEAISLDIQKLSQVVESQNASVTQSSQAIEQMLANISSVTDTLEKNVENVQKLSESSGVGHEGLQAVAESIKEISKDSEGLLEINAVMSNIASQTNLLSMNAAIEAAHAGEAGKGFAVVADEIRKLAESSGEQSKTISTVLKKNKASIDNITLSTNNVLEKFEGIANGIKTVNEQEENIRNAMEGQGAGSQQILEAVGQLNEFTRQVKSGAEGMLQSSGAVIAESHNLASLTEEITSGMNNMAARTGEINLAMTHVSEISEKNKEGIDILVREVAKFKV
jgi:methyl-accepting chemotaxis protein